MSTPSDRGRGRGRGNGNWNPRFLHSSGTRGSSGRGIGIPRGSRSLPPASLGDRGRGQGHDRSTLWRNETSNTGHRGGHRHQEQQSARKIPLFGYKRLYGFLSDESDEVILAIDNDLARWKEDLIDSKKLSQEPYDILILVIHILGEKVVNNDSILLQRKLNIISKTVGEQFCQAWTEKCKEMLSPEDIIRQKTSEQDLVTDHSRNRVLKNLHNVFSFVVANLPTAGLDYIPGLLPGIMGVLGESESSPELDRVKDDFRSLRENITAISKKRKQEQEVLQNVQKRRNFTITGTEEEILHKMEPPEDFRQIPIIPSIEEIKSTELAFLRTNLRHGSYNSASHYLDVQFRLLREDFIQPLKRGVQDFLMNRNDYISRKKRMPMGNVRMYPEVQILSPELVRDTILYKIQLPERIHRRIRWKQSKRLLPGSLLVLSSDNFTTAYFALVARRDEKDLQNGQLDVTWVGEGPNLGSRVESFILLECEVYFEAYRHTLEALKIIPLQKFPMAKFIVSGSSSVEPPEYMRSANLQFEMDKIKFSPLLQETWPIASELGFDDTQFKAFYAALTQEFAIIQGPPGTGKTFLGLKIAEVLLTSSLATPGPEQEDREDEIVDAAEDDDAQETDEKVENLEEVKELNAWDLDFDRGPILVVCYTNHALDQFLDGILNILKRVFPDEDPAMIRVGSRSKSEHLDPYNLAFKRSNHRPSQRNTRRSEVYWDSRRRLWGKIRALDFMRAQVMNEVAALGDPKGIVNFQSLSVWKERPAFSHSIPSEVRNIIESPSELGFRDHFFNVENFKPQNTLMRWFRFNRDPVEMEPIRLKQLLKETEPSNEQEIADEDYDTEELMLHRFEEDWFTEPVGKERPLLNLQHVFGFGIKEMELERERNIAIVRQLQYDEKISLEEKNFRNEELDWKNLLLLNKKILLKEICRLHKAGSMNLPDVHKLMTPSNISLAERKKLYSTLKYCDKWALYFLVLEMARSMSIQLANDLQAKLIEAHKELKELQNYGDGILLCDTKVVGMTTTGAAKHSELLQMMNSKIVIVEEAAEVLESQIVTCLTQHCQHLILIGDHQQLKPSTTVYELSKKYHLDISLFERMLNNNLHCHKLRVQHRMRPEICSLIVGTIYNDLENHASVLNYPEIRGTRKSLFFLAHNEHELAEDDSMSKENPHEAKVLARLCRYLVQQDYKPSQITVITTYTGQMFLLKKEIRRYESCVGVRVTVVDNFQGEENDIILLSLVRSNPENKIGFLQTDNRICVAISRAKHGLFICGNMELLASKSDTWKTIQDKLRERGEVGDIMDLVCQAHGTVSQVKTADDFANVPEGGCSVICEVELKCGHPCKSICHGRDREHLVYKCQFPCEIECQNNHQCQAKCWMDCPPCPVIMEKEIPCEYRHRKDLECHVDVLKYQCTELVAKTLPCTHEQVAECGKNPHEIRCTTIVTITFSDCKHQLEVKCHQLKEEAENPIICKTPCQTRLDCGHACMNTCHANADPEHLEYICEKPCGRTCENGHACATKHKCADPCPPCLVPMNKDMICKCHKTKLKCHQNIADVKCTHPCARNNEPCGHKCKRLCYEPCAPCLTVVEKTAPCGHPVKIACSKFPTKAMCEKLVPPLLKAACGHDTLVPCRKDAIKPEDSVKYCTHPCDFVFSEDIGGCGHRCAGTCSMCQQGRLHLKCQQPCGRQLVCGHVCNSPCSSACPPCKNACEWNCEHSVCKKPCGEPCRGCAENCEWRCKHARCTRFCRDMCNRNPCNKPCLQKLKCGHECIGFCGEPCPPLCRICNTDELNEIILMFGYGEDEDDARRFVYLEDCGHTIEHQGLEYHLVKGIQSETGEIRAKTCPRCSTVIRTSRRYGNILRETMKNVIQVKKRAFGKTPQREKLQMELIREIHENELWKANLPTVRSSILESLARVIMVSAKKSKHNFGHATKERSQQIIQKSIDADRLTSIELMVKHGRDVLKLLIETEDDKVTRRLKPDQLLLLTEKYTMLFKTYMSRIPLTAIEVRSFDREFERLYDARQVYLRKSAPNFYNDHPVATPIYKRALEIAFSPRVYTAEMKKEIHGLLKELDECTKSGLGISDRERREILQAFGLQAGRWFKCPNGHIYVVTECGGVTQESRCNECKAMIGGTNHQLRRDNDIAPEMDGATAPLYPTMLQRR